MTPFLPASSSLPRIPLGTRRLWFLPWPLTLSPQEICVHTHVLGKTGSGKSYFLANLYLSLWRAGLPATLIDPHGDLARLVLQQLVAAGELDTETQRQRLLYLDIPAGEARGRFLPFDFLTQQVSDHTMAEQVADAAKRAWPELATGAPTFDNILKHSVLVLRQNRLPLTELSHLLTDRPFRNSLLTRVTDPQVTRFFHDRVDQWRDEAAMKESTLNRADLLTFSPVLRHMLGAPTNTLNFRRILDTGTSVIINLAITAPDSRRLLGCLLTVGMEKAALSRALDPPEQRQRSHHLLLDEFSQFMAQSEEALTRMLSETRKYRLFCVMAHQNWSQASERLKGALQNCGLEIIFKAGRMDAEYSARLFGYVNPDEVKHTVTDEQAFERTHPAYYSLPEQWERQVQTLQTLERGEAFVRLPNDTVHAVRTPRLPDTAVPARQLAEIQEYYLNRYFVPPPVPQRGSPAAASPAVAPPPAAPALQSSPDAITRRPAPTKKPPQGKNLIFKRDHN